MPHAFADRPAFLAALASLVGLYLLVAALFAAYTPPWQVPDEPAHYNYVRYLAQHHSLPVLHMGDYCAPCLDELQTEGFPPGPALERVDYEFHSPPLYYLLAAPIFLLSGGALLPLRLFSVALGALLVVLAALVVERALRPLPARHALALGTAAVVGLLPQHLAMLSGVNSDALAEVVLAALLLVIAGRLGRVPEARARAGRAAWLPAMAMGILLGLAFWTKATAYVGAGFVALAALLDYAWLRPRARAVVRETALALGLAALIGAPWWLRNIATYGGADFLGLQWHNAVAAQGGQVTTAQWLAAYGLAEYARRMLVTTVQSFWGQLGWMGVVLDARVYFVLVLLSGAALWGLWLYASERGRLSSLPRAVRAALALFAGVVVLTAAAYAWYNLSFVQHQGRYLYTALIPLALGLAAGWRRALQATWREALPGMAWLAALGAAWYVLAGLDMRAWAAGLWALTCAAWLATGLARGRTRLDMALPLAAALGLGLLSLVALFGFVVPQLAR